MDLITQLQDKLDDLALVFGTCIGVLQRDAPPSAFPKSNNNQQAQPPPQEPWDAPTKMAVQVIETSKVIESYIERLPGFDKTENEQYEDLKNLNEESKKVNADLHSSRKDALELLKLVKQSIRYISEEESKNDNEEQQPMDIQ